MKDAQGFILGNPVQPAELVKTNAKVSDIGDGVEVTERYPNALFCRGRARVKASGKRS